MKYALMVLCFFLQVPLSAHSEQADVFRTADELFIHQDYRGTVRECESFSSSSARLRAEALWRVSRADICLGDDAKDPNEKNEWYRKALYSSKNALANDSLNSQAHTWYAVSVGYVSMSEGARAKVRAANEIKDHLLRAIALDPGNDIAYSILGTFYRNVAGVTWIEKQIANVFLGGLPSGGFPEAESVLQKAIELAPTIIRHRYELGMVYDEWGKKEKASAVFRDALKYKALLSSDNTRRSEMQRYLGQ